MNEAVPASTLFNYDTLDTQTRQFIQEKANETHGLLKRTAEHILLIGQNLKVVKEKLPHGLFLLWIETEFEMSRWTAQNFIRVADKLESKWRNFHHLPISVLYELAAPSTSEEILTQVQQGHIPPTLEALKQAKEAECLAKERERQAQEKTERVQQQLSVASTELQEKLQTITQLSEQITQLQEHIATLALPVVEVKEVEKLVVPPEIQTQVQDLQKQLGTLTQQRDTLAHQMAQLREEARAAAQKHSEGEQERRIRLNWYKATNEFRSSVTKILSQWPSPLDILAFEAEDWTRLAQTKEIAHRFLEECQALSQAMVVEGSSVSTKEKVK